MAAEQQVSTNPVSDYELARIRDELVLDGCGKEHADAPLPTGTSMDNDKAGLAENKDAKLSGRRIKPLD
jgi:hypothetical protein